MKYEKNEKELNQKETESVAGGKLTEGKNDLEVKTWRKFPLGARYGGPRPNRKIPILPNNVLDPIIEPKTDINKEECKDLGEEPKNF